jgi:hypothetical protein
MYSLLREPGKMTGDGEATIDSSRKGESTPIMGVAHWPVSHRALRGQHRGVQNRAQNRQGRHLLRLHPRHGEEPLSQNQQPISLIALMNLSKAVHPPSMCFGAALEALILLGAL